jgi:S1-C subfamily serine protease
VLVNMNGELIGIDSQILNPLRRVRAGDVVTAVDETPADHANTLRNGIVSATVRLSIVRTGREQQLNATLVELKLTLQPMMPARASSCIT